MLRPQAPEALLIKFSAIWFNIILNLYGSTGFIVTQSKQ